MKNFALVVAGIIFFFFAMIHLYRLIEHFSVIIGGVSLPLWANAIAFLAFGMLSIWMFYSIREK